MKKIITCSIALLVSHATQEAFMPKMPAPITSTVTPKVATTTVIAPKTPTAAGITIITPKIATPTTIAKTVPAAKTTAVTTTATTKTNLTTLVLRSAFDIQIENTSSTSASITSIAVTYSTSIDGGIHSTQQHETMPLNPALIIPTKQGRGFHAKITLHSPHATISGSFETVTAITVNSQLITLPSPVADSTPIYITSVNGIWKLTTKPKPKTVPTQQTAPTPAEPKANSIQAATVPYLKTTHPKLTTTPVPVKPSVPTTVPPMPVAPKISMAAKASSKAIDQSMTK